jgi:glycosyltransferase involved in cell wall biosynthesis
VSFKLRTLFVDQTGKLGGAEFCLADLAICLKGQSKVFLFEGGPFEDLLSRNGVAVSVARERPDGTSFALKVRKRSRLYDYFRILPSFVSLVVKLARESRDADLLYANTPKALMVTAVTALLLRKPYLFHLHDMIEVSHFNRLNRWLLVTAANWASGVITNSKATEVAFRKAGGRNRNLIVVPNGFRVERFETDVVALSQSIRRSVGNEEQPLVGLFGRITEWKGQRVLIEALSQLPGVRALIVGEALFTDEDQQYKQELSALAEQLGVSDRVHFVGFQSDILAFLKAVDIVVHCSIAPEPFGRVIVEGLLAGKPVIATRGGGPAEIIQDRVTGILVSPGDAGELAKAIQALLQDRKWAEQMAIVGRRFAVRRFALGTVLEEWISFINRSAKGAIDSGNPVSGDLSRTGAPEREVELTGA